MKRKIIRQGNNTLTITLPRKWTQDFKISQGDELDLEITGNRIVLSTQKKATKEKTTKDISNLKSVLPLCILLMYRKGYDEIELHFDNPKLIFLISNLVHQIGFHILEQGSNHCILKTLSDVDDMDSSEMIRKLFLSIKIKLEKIIESLQQNDPFLLQSIIAMNETPGKIKNFCYRLVSKKRFDKSDLGSYYLAILRDLDNLDSLLNILINSISGISDLKSQKKLLSTLEEFERLFELYYANHFAGNLEQFPSLISNTKSFLERVYLQATDLSAEENRMFLLINNSSLHLENLINTTFLMKI
ncbi:AbrB/MazE/SpoVT family DNA-binding domain-containing protein [Candidatus Woesearchaeota archaeon]|nr:AbrB/MazE/SpoVT family DNA-binding domain-containing protein [Candidatus Woesearchaeota archaeon]